MKTSLDDLLRRHPAGTTALPAFTCYNLEQATAVVCAAEAADSPVCMLLAEKAFRGRGGELLAAALVAVADQARVPAGVQLDHTADLDTMRRALDLGATGLMADGSQLPYQENAELVARAVALAEPYGAAVEAELGRVEGDEDAAGGAQVGTMTDPADAAAFAARTGVHALAVAIGNVHGTYPAPPVLDWARLRAIRAGTAVPLTLHGASGLSERDVTRAIRDGIVKINVNTELRRCYFEALGDTVGDCTDGWRLLDLGRSVTAAVGETSSDLLKRYDLSGVRD